MRARLVSLFGRWVCAHCMGYMAAGYEHGMNVMMDIEQGVWTVNGHESQRMVVAWIDFNAQKRRN